MQWREINVYLLNYYYYVELCYIKTKYYNLCWFKIKQTKQK